MKHLENKLDRGLKDHKPFVKRSATKFLQEMSEAKDDEKTSNVTKQSSEEPKGMPSQFQVRL